MYARSFTRQLLSLPLPLLLLGFSAPGHAGGFSLQLDTRGVAPMEVHAIEKFLARSQSLLPARLKQTLDRTVTVHFVKTDDSSTVQTPACIGDQPDPDAQNQVLAFVRQKLFTDRSKLKDLYLNQNLKPLIVAGESAAKTYSCGHRNLYRLALASAVHEIGHLYDFADPKTPAEKRELQICQAQASMPGKGPSNGLTPDCLKLKNRLTVSNRADFLDLMGWVETGLIFHTRGQSNQATLRSPDPYEFKNWKEAFAVNLEYFLMDPEFACRRPAVHSFYQRHFGVDPQRAARTCTPQTTISVSGGFGSGQALTADLDPSRVYEIHALFAGKGPALMSKWGHSLYRIIICAPERPQVGPECLNDVAHHIAISFRANVSDSSISYWKGLKGDYPSLLFAQPFLGVIEEYNKSEFRELTSLPLRLTTEEKTFFLYRALESYWEYGGRYKFITNNCATEALNFLKGTLGETRLSRKHPLSPLGLHETLQKLGIVDASVLADRQKAVEQGYFYASKKPEVDNAFAGIVKNCGGANCALPLPKTSDEYLVRTRAADRRGWYDTLLSSSGESRQVLASRFFLLESYVQRKANAAYSQRLAQVIEAGKFDGLPREAVDSAAKIQAALTRLREIQQLSLPSNIASTGYGIPIRAATTEPGAPGRDVTIPPELLAEQRQLLQEVIDWSRMAFAAWLSEIDATQKNRLFFLKEMRAKPQPTELQPAGLR
jgi:hypothetical protein